MGNAVPATDAQTVYPHTMRLQRFLARAGVASRRGSEDLMTAGRVTVNGEVATELGTKVAVDRDRIEVDGMPVKLNQGAVYLMLYKPTGYLTTMSDPQERPCVADLVPRDRFPGLFPVGRLDRDTTGLLLFTTDGDLSQDLLHPSKHVYKTYQALVDGHLTDRDLEPLRRGIELGEAMRDFAYADELLSRLPELDFVIGSQHQLSEKYDWNGLYFLPEATEQEAREQIADYLTLVLETAKWGKFSVLGHLTLPLRYMNENHGMHMSFDGFEDEVAQVFRALIENGCGIECNVNRGNTPLPDAKWLRLYHELGGEIITIGTDAHTPEFVGMRARETQELLKNCGLDYVCTFEKKKPVFHKI